MTKRLILAAAAALVLGGLPFSPALTQASSANRPPLLRELIGCRSLADASARLACFDRTAAAVDAAEKRKDLVVVDRDQLRTTRRTLFGLTLPNLSIFGDDSQEEEGVSRIETTIRGASQTPYRKWLLTLQDGAQWEQIDGRELSITPRAGHSIKIRRGAVGSYLANVQNQTAIRVRRVR